MTERTGQVKYVVCPIHLCLLPSFAGAIIYADKGYCDYGYEDLLGEVGLHLKAQRKKNSKRPLPAWDEFLGKPVRQYIEVLFSRLTSLFPKKIHAVTPRGFELKIVCFL